MTPLAMILIGILGFMGLFLPVFVWGIYRSSLRQEQLLKHIIAMIANR
jgi:hypothetical protein